jgi:hypothetical protein
MGIANKYAAKIRADIEKLPPAEALVEAVDDTSETPNADKEKPATVKAAAAA